ncbi:hypothetical protein JXJ21_22425 [candidate division KSB1 bacterium]|nr:hypothetical protein [candidate division KSB1 bacterium]
MEIDEEQIPANKIVGIKVQYIEKDVGIFVRKAGGTWDKKKQLWQLPYFEVIHTDLQDRIGELSKQRLWGEHMTLINLHF